MTPVNLRHEAMLVRLIAVLAEYCRAHPDWICIASNAVFTMASGNWRLPDASLVQKARFPEGEVPATKADFAPDIAFEILSPSDTLSVIQRKRKDYQESGVVQVGIDPEKRLVELIHPDRAAQYFEVGQHLAIVNLPEFSLELKSLFSI